MLSAIEQLAQKYPMSKWTEEALMAAGNYYWVDLDRNKAAAYYQRLLDTFPAGKYAINCEWRGGARAVPHRAPNRPREGEALSPPHPPPPPPAAPRLWFAVRP